MKINVIQCGECIYVRENSCGCYCTRTSRDFRVNPEDFCSRAVQLKGAIFFATEVENKSTDDIVK